MSNQSTEVLSFAHDPDRQKVRDAKESGRFVYVGRMRWFRPKGQRDWGNYAPDGKVDKDAPDQHAEQHRAVEAFRQWIQTQPDLMAHVHELKGKALVCHCRGLPCHASVLRELAG